MSHVSIELAEQLKKTGLRWVPQPGDWFKADHFQPMLLAFQSTIKQYIQITDTIDESFPNTRTVTIEELLKENYVWLPTLSQLLTEIEKQGWQADSVQANGKYACDIAFLSETVHTKYQTFEGDTREDATAMALLWILNRQKEITYKEGAHDDH